MSKLEKTNSETALFSQPNPLDGLWEELARADPAQTARQSAAALRDGFLQVQAIGRQFQVFPRQRRISSNGQEPPFLYKLLLLQYLLRAKESPAAGRLIGARQLPGGEFFFRGPHALSFRALEKRFGRDKESFVQAGVSLGAKEQSLAEAAFTLAALPRVPLTYTLWCADDEFPARVKVLFDAGAGEQLPLDMLWVLVRLSNDRLLQAGGGREG